MAKHKFIKAKSEMDEADAIKNAKVTGPGMKSARAKLASMGKDIPGPLRSKTATARIKTRYGDK